MGRNLEQLQKQYNSSASFPMGGRGPRGGGHGARAAAAKGAPKDTRNTIKRILGYMHGYGFRLILVLFCMLISTVTSLIGGYLMAPIIDKLTLAAVPSAHVEMTAMERSADKVISGLLNGLAKTGSGGEVSFAGFEGAMVYVIIALILLGCIYLVGVVTTYLQGRLMLSISQGFLERIRNDLFTKLQSLPVRYFDSHPTGEVMSRFTNDVDAIDMMINNSLTSLISGAVTLIGTFVFMISTSWILTIVVIAFIPIFGIGGAKFAKISQKHFAAQQAALGAVNGYIEESITGQKVVKVFNHEETCMEEFDLLNKDMKDKQFKAQFWGVIMMPVMGNTSQISYAVTVGIGGILMLSGLLTPGGLTVFAGYSRQFNMPINQIAQQMATIFAALAGAERVFQVIDAEPEPTDVENANPMPDMKGDVVLEHVTFGYNPEKTVLKDISLYAHPGQKIAFVGSTGAGKTTVTNLLNRFYDIEEGTITIDGVNIKDMERDVLRKNIAMVLQDTHLFTGTIMENIRYGRLDATDEEVIQAAKTASAHSFIMRLSDGYNTMLEGDGSNLSQGQRQLLNIARAALSTAPILVLDEATSSVDTRTERHIEHGMDRLMKNRTTFVIAHRLSTVRNSNAIMVLEHGEIMERGTHDELLAMKGRYYELYTGLKELD